MNHDTLTVTDALIPCRTRDADLWWSDYREDQDEAAAACWSSCPLRDACYAGAVDRREPAGVWGGWRFAKGRPTTAVPVKSRALPEPAEPVQPVEPVEPDGPRRRERCGWCADLMPAKVRADAQVCSVRCRTDRYRYRDNPRPGSARQRRKTDVAPDRVAAAVASVRAGLLDSGHGLTFAERNAVIRAVYPGMARALLAELLGCSLRTVARAAGPATRIREAADAAREAA